MSVIVLSPFTIDPDKHAAKHAIIFKDKSLTVQADAEAADINNIVRNFGLTGGLPYGNLQPIYDDFSQMPTDYHTALSFIREADSAFLELPAQVRSRFDNDPGVFLNSLSDPSKRPLFEELGLVPPLPVDAAPGQSAQPEPPPAEPKDA